jgi:hypothetical protein
MFQKEYLDCLASRNTWRVLRLLCGNLHRSFGITELSALIGISRSNVFRAFNRLESAGISRVSGSGRKKTYRLDPSSPFAFPVWELVVSERYMGLKPSVKNALSLLVNDISSISECCIAFGSALDAGWSAASDIDLCLVTDNESDARKRGTNYFPDLKFELHAYSAERFKAIEDFVVLEALLHGLPLHGRKLAFDTLADLKKIPTMYLAYRLSMVRKIEKEAALVSGEAREYFRGVERVALGEIAGVLKNGRTLKKGEIKDIDIESEIKKLENEIAERGEAIWLS